MTIGSYFSSSSDWDALPQARIAVDRHANTTVHDFVLKLVTTNNPQLEEDFEYLLEVELPEGNRFVDLRSVYDVFALALSDTPS